MSADFFVTVRCRAPLILTFDDWLHCEVNLLDISGRWATIKILWSLGKPETIRDRFRSKLFFNTYKISVSISIYAIKFYGSKLQFHHR